MNNFRKKFGKIYDQYIDKIYRFIFLKVNSEEIAQDLCSETFLRGWEAFKKANNPHKNNQQIENPSAFLYQIARNLVIDHYRQKGKTQIVSAELTSIIDPRPDLEEKTILRSDLNTIRMALAELKEEYQNVIVWHYLDDLPIRQVAEMLGRTEGAARVLLHRALQSLRKKLNQPHQAQEQDQLSNETFNIVS